jgi:hypothetical protein
VVLGVLLCAAIGASQTASTASAGAFDRAEEEEEDPLRFGLPMAMIDGGWSILTTAAWLAATRGWDAPYPYGVTGATAARVLYGTPWTFLIAGELALARALAGPRYGSLRRARAHFDWLAGVAVPSRCPAGAPLGAGGSGCGLGLGGMSAFMAEVRGGPVALDYRFDGGWLVGRVADDAQRTLAESVWVIEPAALVVRVELPLGDPLALELDAGVGLLFGMHNAHVHPRPEGVLQPSLAELSVRDAGIGPDLRFGAALFALDGRVALEGEAALAPLAGHHETAALTGLVVEPPGLPVWRSASAGVSALLPPIEPVRLSLRVWAAELSTRPLLALGHRALMLRFSVPLPLPADGT